MLYETGNGRMDEERGGEEEDELPSPPPSALRPPPSSSAAAVVKPPLLFPLRRSSFAPPHTANREGRGDDDCATLLFKAIAAKGIRIGWGEKAIHRPYSSYFWGGGIGGKKLQGKKQRTVLLGIIENVNVQRTWVRENFIPRIHGTGS